MIVHGFLNPIVFLFLILQSYGTICLGKSYSDQRPNFIFILTDDQSYSMMGCTGNQVVHTPQLDKLASEGMLFTNAHITSAICTPSRVSILLSQFERKHGVNFNSGTSVAPEAWEDAYPVVMRKAGYYTGYVGKNHAPIGKGGYQSGLMEKSFDYWYAGHGHLKFYPKQVHDIFKHAQKDTQPEIIQEGALDFLDNNHSLEGALHFLDKRPEDKPFSLSICFNLPHSAGTSSMRLLPEDSIIYRDLYRDSDIPLPENYIAKADIQNPKLPLEILHTKDRQSSYDFVDDPASVRERYIRQYQAMTGIDGLVGNLRKKLKELNLDRHTIIIFTSDHGLFMGQFGLGGKALCYEVVTHIPMIIYNPLLPKKTRNQKINALVQSIDIAPTMLALADISIPKSYQGLDLAPLMEGNVSEVRSYLYTENLWSTHFGNPRCESVQNMEWKYIRYYKNENISVLEKIKISEELSINKANILYGVHDNDIVVYRNYIESPIKEERPVYEELYHLSDDPNEMINLAKESEFDSVLIGMRKFWKAQIKEARSNEYPKVLRYTSDSKSANN